MRAAFFVLHTFDIESIEVRWRLLVFLRYDFTRQNTLEDIPEHKTKLGLKFYQHDFLIFQSLPEMRRNHLLQFFLNPFFCNSIFVNGFLKRLPPTVCVCAVVAY
jgi:hypothetical protein